MPFADFANNYSSVYICRVLSAKEGWSSAAATGAWSVEDDTAGGCANFPTFAKNPQYRLTVTGAPADVLITMQQASGAGAEGRCIGFAGFQNGGERVARARNKELSSGSYSWNREVHCDATLAPGAYTIVPTTFNAYEDGRFCLKVWFKGDEGGGVELEAL